MKKQHSLLSPFLQTLNLENVLLSVVLLNLCPVLYGQEWHNPLAMQNTNFYDIQQSFNALYECPVKSNGDTDSAAYSAPITSTTVLSSCAKVPVLQGVSVNTYLGYTTLYWGNQTDVSQYKVEWKKTTDIDWQYAFVPQSNFLSYSLTGLAASALYEWRVSSICLDQMISDPSGVQLFQAPALACAGAASRPHIYLSTLLSNAAFIGWSPTNGKGYVFAYRKTGEALWSYRTFSNTSYFQLDGLTPSTAYECKVKAVCDGLNDIYSTILPFTTKPANNCADQLVPLATYSATNITGTSATLSWGGLPDATSYRLEVYGFPIQTVTDTSYNMIGLTAGNWYDFKVTPICATGSPFLYPFTYRFRTTGSGCQAPPPMTTLATATATTAKIYWGPVGGTTNYIVQYRLADPANYHNSSNPSTTFSTANTNFQLTGLAPHTSYDYIITTSTDNCSYSYNTVTTTDIETTVRPFPSGLPTCLEDDFRELEKLYDATGGDNWTNKSNWLTNPNMATWYGITLANSGCNVGQINLNNNNLVGALPMLSFSELVAFRGQTNKISGTIPNFDMPNLLSFIWSDNQLSGSIPNFAMPQLRDLILFRNQLTGSIPNFNMTNLLNLHLANNQLSGSIPNFNMPSLQQLFLNNNRLTGAIPNFSMTNLLMLGLNENQLSGLIPNFNMPNLQQLFLYKNQLTGAIPNFSMASLQFLIMNDNQLSGSIPNFTMPVLQELYVNYNQLTGSIPNFTLPNLQKLDIGGNLLTGSIPNFNLPNLRVLYAYTNQLSGTVPNFSSLPKLTSLVFNENQLTGSIPNFTSLPLLDTVFLRHNQLTGGIPNFAASPNISTISIRNNQLTGPIPDFNLAKLKILRVDTNQLSGHLPNLSNAAFVASADAYFSLDMNKFIFGNFESKPWLNIAYIKYAPQAKIPITLTNGQLVVNTGSANNVQQFQWYKDGALVATTQSNQYQPIGLGTYYCKITHNTLTVGGNTNKNLILQSNDYNMSVLPVELLNLTATPLSKTVQLSWQTATEKNADHFEIERSSDGKTFDKIGQVKANGNSTFLTNYGFVDDKPFNGVNYYRLRQFDSDGKEILSNILSIAMKSDNKLKTYPNPVSTFLNIETESTGDFHIINLLGQELMRGKITKRLDVSALPQGAYMLKIGIEQAKFMKE